LPPLFNLAKAPFIRPRLIAHICPRSSYWTGLDEGTIMTAKTHFPITGKAPLSGPKHTPFGERPTCSVDEATKASGLSRSMIYNKMQSGEIEWTKVNARRLIKVKSLLRLLGVT
jgi:hypothetical protein